MTIKVWTITALLDETKKYFERSGVDSPRLTAELLLVHALGYKKRIDLYLKFDQPITESELTIYRDAVRRRASGEPTQYIIGETEFYGLPIFCSPAALIPRPETELLVENIIAFVETRHGASLRILEIGTGTGCIAIALAKRLPDALITATDISTEALTLAKKNAERNNVQDNITFIQQDFLQSADNWQLTTDNYKLTTIDLLVSNPPYIAQKDVASLQKEVREHEPLVALTDNSDGLAFYKHIIECIPQLSTKTAIVEIGSAQAEKISELARAENCSIEIHNDYAGIPRVAIISKT